MAFDSLGDRLQESLKKLRGKGTINEADIREAMREVKLALLEAVLPQALALPATKTKFSMAVRMASVNTRSPQGRLTTSMT